MKAFLHIVPASFNVADLPDAEICERLKNFALLTKYISDKNKLYPESQTQFILKKDRFKRKIIFSGVTFEDLVLTTNPEYDERCPRDIRTKLRMAFANNIANTDKQHPVPHTLRKPTMEERHGLCVLRHYGRFNKIPQVVADIQDFVAFRLNHFVEFQDSDKFFEECTAFLDNLVFHKDIKHEYVAKYKSHRAQICRGLLMLNFNYLQEVPQFTGQIKDYTEYFAKLHAFEAGSSEGNPAKMNAHARVFPGRKEKVVPDPHLKFYHEDDGTPESHARIYFETPRKDLDKLYICYILKHL